MTKTITDPIIQDAVIDAMFDAGAARRSDATPRSRDGAMSGATTSGAENSSAENSSTENSSTENSCVDTSDAMSLAKSIDDAVASVAPECAGATLGCDAIPRLMKRMDRFAALIEGQGASFLVFEDMSALAIDDDLGLDHHRPLSLADYGFDDDLRCAIRNIDHPDCIVKTLAPHNDANPAKSATMQLRHALYDMADDYRDPRMQPKDYQYKKNWTDAETAKLRASIATIMIGIDFPRDVNIYATARWLDAPAKVQIDTGALSFSTEKDGAILEAMIAEMVDLDGFVGCDTEYNGGDIKRRSGFTVSASVITAITVNAASRTAHEKIAARKRLDAMAIAKFGDRSRASAMASLAADIAKKLG